jgi:translation initiation factor IF-1
MARIRTIKPEFFCHEELFDLEAETGLPIRIAFAGMWTVCDREGRFKWRPRSIKAQVLPFDDVDFSRVLDALATRGFVVRYASNGTDYGHVPGFARHQVINNREADSVLPEPTETQQTTGLSRVDDACPTREERVPHASKAEGKGRERKEGKGNSCSESGKQTREPAFDPAACGFPVFPCSGNPKTWQATERQLAEWSEAYPAVDVAVAHRRAHAWVMANIAKRKTAAGYAKFLNAWLSKEQDSGKSQRPAAEKTYKATALTAAEIEELNRTRDPEPFLR